MDDVTEIVVNGDAKFQPGQTVMIGPDPCPPDFWGRLWWHLRKPIGGPVFLVKPRTERALYTITDVTTTGT